MIVKREVLQDILEGIEVKKIIILRGSRQVGKTTLLQSLQEILTKAQKKTIFIFCDDQRFQSKVNTVQDFIQYLQFEHEYILGEAITVFLDEFQSIPQSGMFLKNIYDMYPNLQIIASGSSSLEITKNSEFLTGRKIMFDIFPFSFREYLRARQWKMAETQFSLERFEEMEQFYRFYSRELEHYFEEYCTIGGYPEIVLSNGNVRNFIAKDIIETYINKDITQFLRIENVKAFNHLLRIAASQIGSLVNKTEISNTLGIAINTLSKYFDIFEGTFVFRFVTPYFSNIRKEISKMPKIYASDIGMRNYILYNTLEMLPIQDMGNIVENFVYTELLHKKNANKVFFYRTIAKSEIDFIIQKNAKYIPLEVKYRSAMPSFENIKAFSKNYKQYIEKSIIVSKSLLQKNETMVHVPACLWGLVDEL